MLHIAPAWQEKIDPHLETLAQQTAEPFAMPVLRSLFKVMQTLMKYADTYELVVGDDIAGRGPALVAWRLINLQRENMGLPRADLRLINGRSRACFPNHFIPEGTADGCAVMVTDAVAHAVSANNLIPRIANRRRNGRVDLATAGAKPFGLRPSGLKRDALYVVGGDLALTNPHLHPNIKWGGPGELLYGHPAWIGVTKEQTNSQFAVVQSPARFDAEAVARFGQDMDRVVTVFADLLGIEQPETLLARE